MMDTAMQISEMRRQENFLRPFLLALRAESVRYCILHSYEGLPVYSESDVDMALHGISREQFEDLLQRVAREAGWEVVQRLWYDVPTCFYYMVRSLSDPGAWVAVDILLDPEGIGRYGFDTELLTRDAVAHGIFFHSNPSVEFCYKLTKRIRKGHFKSGDPITLNTLYRDADKPLVRRVLSQHYGVWGARRIMAVFERTGGVGDDLPEMRILSLAQLLKRRYLAIPRLLKRLVWQARRMWNRVTEPAGLVLRVPRNSEMELQQFAQTLWEQIGPAFRRLRVDSRGSLWRRFAALSSSTLLVCADAPGPGAPRLQRSLFAPVQKSDGIAASVDQGVLDVLRSRMARRLHTPAEGIER